MMCVHIFVCCVYHVCMCLQAAASRLDAVVAVGYVELGNAPSTEKDPKSDQNALQSPLYNSVVVVSPEGDVIANYQKVC